MRCIKTGVHGTQLEVDSHGVFKGRGDITTFVLGNYRAVYRLDTDGYSHRTPPNGKAWIFSYRESAYYEVDEQDLAKNSEPGECRP